MAAKDAVDDEIWVSPNGRCEVYIVLQSQPEVSDIIFSSEVSAFNIVPIARFAWVKS